MGLLDKVVKSEIEKDERKTREEMSKLSREELKKREDEDRVMHRTPFIRQGLMEFLHAMEEIGVEPLPLVVKRKQGFFSSKAYKVLRGYYLCERFGKYRLFISADGKYYTGVEILTGNYRGSKEVRNRSLLSFPIVDRDSIGNPPRMYLREFGNIYEEEIGEEEAVSMIADDLLVQCSSLKDTGRFDETVYFYPDMHEALKKGDFETAVTGLFSLYVSDNKKHRDNLLKFKDRKDFLDSL